MSKQAMLTAIRRGLKRGPLPADETAMLHDRMTRHPRHLIPARSRLPHPEQVDLFVHNVEKEFGSVTRVPDRDAIPGAVADYLAAQNLPGSLIVAPHPDLRPFPGSLALYWKSAKAGRRRPMQSACSMDSPASPRPGR